MNTKFKVTQKHIDEGIRIDPDGCPLTLAVREGSSAKEVWTGPYHVYIDRVRYLLPAIAAEFRRDFDDGLPVSPFEFDLRDA